jgi:hypothetical protein
MFDARRQAWIVSQLEEWSRPILMNEGFLSHAVGLGTWDSTTPRSRNIVVVTGISSPNMFGNWKGERRRDWTNLDDFHGACSVIACMDNQVRVLVLGEERENSVPCAAADFDDCFWTGLSDMEWFRKILWVSTGLKET